MRRSQHGEGTTQRIASEGSAADVGRNQRGIDDLQCLDLQRLGHQQNARLPGESVHPLRCVAIILHMQGMELEWQSPAMSNHVRGTAASKPVERVGRYRSHSAAWHRPGTVCQRATGSIDAGAIGGVVVSIRHATDDGLLPFLPGRFAQPSSPAKQFVGLVEMHRFLGDGQQPTLLALDRADVLVAKAGSPRKAYLPSLPWALARQ